MERPSPCEDLFEFAECHGGSIDEGLACVIMRQATQAAYMCCHRGVLHGDIKLENLLINKETHEVKLIDFGCGDLLKKSAYKIFTGVYYPSSHKIGTIVVNHIHVAPNSNGCLEKCCGIAILQMFQNDFPPTLMTWTRSMEPTSPKLACLKVSFSWSKLYKGVLE